MEPTQSTHLDPPPPSPSEAEPLHITATLEHIFISPGHDYWGKRGDDAPKHGIQDVALVRCVAGRGLEGDRYFAGKAGKAGQVTFFEAEVFDAIRERFGLPALPAHTFRRNLIVRGMPLRDLLGRRFSFQGITFEGAQECKPCLWMDRMVATGARAFMGESFRGGLRARVCTTGLLRAGKSE